jgi:excinuclease ABC subunit C
MPAVSDAIAAKLPHLPESPGVYLWKDAEGVVLYVGKAKRLRLACPQLLRQRSSRERQDARADASGGRIVETIVVPTEAHALILEANLIKEYRRASTSRCATTSRIRTSRSRSRSRSRACS